jgi:hypothetical protein
LNPPNAPVDGAGVAGAGAAGAGVAGAGAGGCGAVRALADAPAFSFAGDALGGLALATRLLARGAAVARVPGTGELSAAGIAAADLEPLAAALHVDVRPADAAPAGAVALRVPRVALLDDLVPAVTGPPGQEDSTRHESRAWMAFLLRDRLGLTVADLSPARLEAGLDPATITALVLPDGGGALPPAALSAIRAYAQAGGTVVAIGELGLTLAQRAELTTTREDVAGGAGLLSAGATFAVDVDPADPLAWGVASPLFVLDAGAPVLSADAAGIAVARHPAAPRLVAGYASGTTALARTPVVLDQAVGAGRLALFAIDPAYRGYVDGLSRLLVNALLAPPASADAR